MVKFERFGELTVDGLEAVTRTWYNVPEEAVYAKTQTDTDGQPLNSGSKYLIHLLRRLEVI